MREEEAIPRSERFLVVGLGNPGRDYRDTRHNIGFMLLDRLAERWHIPLGRVQSRAVIGSGHLGAHAVLLAKPQTYMNLSGDAVGPLANFYRVPATHVIVGYDEIDLEFGTLRIRPQGGAGGHNGMKSLINHLGRTFPRVRLGVGRPPGRMPASAYVLRRFRADELPVVDTMLDQAAAAIETIIRDGLELAMNRYNGSVLQDD